MIRKIRGEGGEGRDPTQTFVLILNRAPNDDPNLCKIEAIIFERFFSFLPPFSVFSSFVLHRACGVSSPTRSHGIPRRPFPGGQSRRRCWSCSGSWFLLLRFFFSFLHLLLHALSSPSPSPPLPPHQANINYYARNKYWRRIQEEAKLGVGWGGVFG